MDEQDYLTPPVFNGYSSDGTIRSTRDLRPAHFLLKIESYSNLCDKGPSRYESSIFEVGGYKWNLCFDPKGNHQSGGGNDHISLYLKLANKTSLRRGWEVKAKFTFFVFDQIRDNYLTIKDGTMRRFHEMKTEWGVPHLLPLDIFKDVSNGYLVDDSCKFGVEVFVFNHTGRMECFPLVKKPSNHIHTWDIKKFSKLKDNFYKDSKGFWVEEVYWRLYVRPQGEELAVFLENTSNRRAYAECKYRVMNQLDSERNQERTGSAWFCPASRRSWGFCDIISLKKLEDTSNGYILKDRLILEVEFIAVSVTKSSS